MKTFAFDLQLFAAAPSAELVTLGIGKETTFGTAVPPTTFLIPSTHAFDISNSLIPREGARKRVGQTEQLTGLVMGKGSMTVEADGDTLGSLLLCTFGAESIAANAGNPSALAVTTTSSGATAIGFQAMTPAAMTNIVVGQKLTIDTAGLQESVIVRAISTTQFWAYFTKAHASGVTITNAAVVLAQDHTFTFSSPRPSFTAQLNDVIAARNAFGCKVSQFDLTLTPKQILEPTVQVEYQSEAHVNSPVSPTYSTLQGFTFLTPGNAVTMNGVALDSSVQGMKMSINTGLITDYPKFGNNRLRPNIPEAQTVVKLTLDLAFETETMLQQAWGVPGATGPQGQVMPAPIVFTIQGSDYINTAVPYQLVLKFPMAKVSTAPIIRKMKDYIKQTVTFECSESTNGAGDDCQAILTNASSAASL